MEIPGEHTETANKRNEVHDLHASEPWLTPDEAAATLQMPLNNLRIFTQQLDIEWGQQPRPPAPASKAMQPTAGPTLADRVKAQHQLHPTWTARMIAQALGEKETSVSTLLAIARKATRAQVEAKPEFASKREMLQHYGDVALRLGKGR
jgi:DNA primase